MQHKQTTSGIKEMQEGRCTGIHLCENSPVELGIQLGAQ